MPIDFTKPLRTVGTHWPARYLGVRHAFVVLAPGGDEELRAYPAEELASLIENAPGSVWLAVDRAGEVSWELVRASTRAECQGLIDRFYPSSSERWQPREFAMVDERSTERAREGFR
jgi:hypothetical protein